ncbi:MAG: vWA domain-containing protein, partial [Shimia sp.]
MRRIWTATLAALLLAAPAHAQGVADIADLTIAEPAQCAATIEGLRGFESGGQWLIGRSIDLYGQPNAQRPLQSLSGAFEPVTCYGVEPTSNRVFVADAGGETCGWVAREDLLDENVGGGAFAASAICPTPRAMSLEAYCAEIGALGLPVAEACDGVPFGLRAKGVLTGNTATDAPVPFLTDPEEGGDRGAKSFFSVLEIHDVALGQGGQAHALVGDGEGDMFGWIASDQIELWPTRLGLFYGTEGDGAMFGRQRDLIQNWRTGAPVPDITAGLSADALQAYVHGDGALLSYPIIRTVDPEGAASAGGDTGYHEVIFLGQQGEGSAAQLLEEAALARRAEALTRVNIMIVVDTTESMRPVLPALRQGIADFIAAYGVDAQADTLASLPEVRLGVFAYSDFQSPDATAIGDPIDTQQLLPPIRIGPGFQAADRLGGITGHEGLNDA